MNQSQQSSGEHQPELFAGIWVTEIVDGIEDQTFRGSSAEMFQRIKAAFERDQHRLDSDLAKWLGHDMGKIEVYFQEGLQENPHNVLLIGYVLLLTRMFMYVRELNSAYEAARTSKMHLMRERAKVLEARAMVKEALQLEPSLLEPVIQFHRPELYQRKDDEPPDPTSPPPKWSAGADPARN